MLLSCSSLDVGSPKAIRLDDCEKMVTKTTGARETGLGACLTVVEFLGLLLLVPFYWPLIRLD